MAEDTTAASHDLVSTVEDLIMHAPASSNLVGDAQSSSVEHTDSVSVSASGDASASESQTSVELRDMLNAVCRQQFGSSFRPLPNEFHFFKFSWDWTK